MIRCFAAPHIPLNTISHLLLDQVLPRALCHLGETILHASSVAINGQAVAFMGETGSGKSTLCASLCKQGFPLITDDSLLVKLEADHFIAYSSYPALRLWSDSVGMFSGASTEMRRVAHYNEKNFLNVTDNTLVFSEDAMPLQRVYLLGDVTRNVSIEPVLPRDIATEIIKASFPLDNTDKDRLKQDFVLFTQMANIIPFYRLSYPRDVASLPDVHQAILEHQP
jgi:hypothetical protein